VAYRIVVASLVVCLLLVVGLLLLERTGFLEIDEKAIQPEVVSCQIGHKDMEVRVLGQEQRTVGRSSPGTSSGSRPTGIRKDFHTAVTLRITGYAEPTSGLEPLSCSLLVRCPIAKDAGCVSFQSALLPRQFRTLSATLMQQGSETQPSIVSRWGTT
jgi:hypothetical protein